MARAFGMYAERVEKVEDLAGAIERGLAHRPASLDVVVTTAARRLGRCGTDLAQRKVAGRFAASLGTTRPCLQQQYFPIVR